VTQPRVTVAAFAAVAAITATVFVATNDTPTVRPGCTDPAARTAATRIWSAAPGGGNKFGGRARVEADSGSGDTGRLYDAGGRLQPMVAMAIGCADTKLAVDITQAVTPAVGWMSTVDDPRYQNSGVGDYMTWVRNPVGLPPYRIGPGGTAVEAELDVAEFVAPVARLAAYLAGVPDRPPVATAWLKTWAPIIRDHVHHWVVRQSWQPPINATVCKINPVPFSTYGTSNRGHEQRLARIGGDNNVGALSVCNTIDDRDLLVTATAAALLTATLRDPAALPLTGTTGCVTPQTPCGLSTQQLTDYLTVANGAFRAHQTTTALTDLNGRPVTGRVFDATGLRDLTQDYGWSGVTDRTRIPNGGGIECGGPNQPVNVAAAPGSDMGHFRRWVDTAAVLRDVPAQTGAPTDVEMEQFANQFANAVWNKSTTTPEFANYENANGWYRVFYNGRNGFGYSPSNLGNVEVLRGGFGTWAVHNPDVRRAMDATRTVLEATSGPAQAHRFASFTGPWFGCVRSSSIDVDPLYSPVLQAFYASLVTPAVAPVPQPTSSTTTTSTTTIPATVGPTIPPATTSTKPVTSIFYLRCNHAATKTTCTN
jgi:hypothetical protein